MCDCIYFRRNLDFLHTYIHCAFVQEAISRIRYVRGKTNTSEAIRYVRTFVRRLFYRSRIIMRESFFFGNYVQKFSESRARCARRFMPIIMPIHWSIYHEFFFVVQPQFCFCFLFVSTLRSYTSLNRQHVNKRASNIFFYPKRHRKQKTKAPKVVQKSKLRGLTSGLRGLPGFAKDGQLATRKIKSNRIIAGSLHVSVCCCHSDFNCSFLCARPSQLSTVSSFPRNAWSGFV